MTFNDQQIQDHVKKLQKQGLSGDGLYKKMYDDANSFGVSASQIESAMGYQSGAVNDWTNSKGLKALSQPASAQSNRNLTVYPSGASLSSANKSLAASTGSSQGSNPGQGQSYSDAEIKQYVDNLSASGLQGRELENQIYLDAIKFGVDGDRLEAAMGWKAGTVSDWTSKHGVQPLSEAIFPSYSMRPTTASTVQGQLGGLLSAENPLMRRAYYKGLDFANSRGNLNSSMAAEAGQAAMMDVALPIAQTDAAANNQYGLLAAQRRVHQDNMRLQNQLQQGNMNLQQRFNLDNLAIQNQYQQSNMGLQNGYQQANMQLDNQLRTGLLRSQTDEALRQAGVTSSANTQGKYLDSVDEIIRQATISINEIETSANISADDKQKMITDIIGRRDSDLKFARNLYSSMPTWDFSWINLPNVPDAPGLA